MNRRPSQPPAGGRRQSLPNDQASSRRQGAASRASQSRSATRRLRGRPLPRAGDERLRQADQARLGSRVRSHIRQPPLLNPTNGEVDTIDPPLPANLATAHRQPRLGARCGKSPSVDLNNPCESRQRRSRPSEGRTSVELSGREGSASGHRLRSPDIGLSAESRRLKRRRGVVSGPWLAFGKLTLLADRSGTNGQDQCQAYRT